jgi:dihydroorotase
MGQSVYSPIVDDGVLFESFRRVAAVDRPMGVHAENNALMTYFAEDLKRRGRTDALAHFEARPGVVEDEAVNRALFYTRVAGNRLHVHHVGSAAAAAQIGEAKGRGERVTAETCPHYLLLSTEDYARLGNLMRVNPSIKTPADRDGLWRRLRDGSIDTLGSDHAPHSDDEKLEPDVWKALSGWTGVETLVPLMLSEVRSGRLPWSRFVNAVAERPAQIFGLYPRKGSLALGSHADIAVIDLDAPWTIDQRRLHSKSPITPFHGWKVRGRVTHTVVRGTVVARDGTVEGPPTGRFVPVV